MSLLRLMNADALRMRVLVLLVAIASIAPHARAGQSSAWDQPAAGLAEQVAAIAGPGQVHLTWRNVSSIGSDDVAFIRRLLEQDLKARGITSSSEEAANSVRITFSESRQERLWVAEIAEGNETHVAMVHFEQPHTPAAPGGVILTLRRQTLLSSPEPVLAALETVGGLVTLAPERIVVYTRDTGHEQFTFPIRSKRQLARDPRGIVLPHADGIGFDAYLPGTRCEGTFANAPSGQWSVHCSESDDPWPLTLPSNLPDATPAPAVKAFFNAARNYFTGVIAPRIGIDLPPFYAAGWIPRSGPPAMMINAVDGRFQLAGGGVLQSVSGTRDWGSDFAVLHTTCGSQTQIIVSGSGTAAQDTLRAYELPANEAVPASAPVDAAGTVTALWSAPDEGSVFAVVRTAAPQGQTARYEVDRVSATCN